MITTHWLPAPDLNYHVKVVSAPDRNQLELHFLAQHTSQRVIRLHLDGVAQLSMMLWADQIDGPISFCGLKVAQEGLGDDRTIIISGPLMARYRLDFIQIELLARILDLFIKSAPESAVQALYNRSQAAPRGVIEVQRE